MKPGFIFVFLLAIPIPGLTQNPIADTLKKELERHTQEDTVRVNLLNQLAFESYFDYPSEAVTYALEAGTISDKIKYLSGKGQTYRMLGLTFWAQANLSYALSYFVRGLKLADSLGEKQLQADITGNIGLVYIGMSNHETALKYFNSSVYMQRQLKNSIREAAMLNNVGDCYFAMRKYDSALLIYQEAIEKGKPLHFGIATNTRNMGNVYEALGEFDRALIFYTKARSISDSLSDHRGMTLVRKSIASILFHKKEYSLAEKITRECLAIGIQSNLKAIVRDSYELLSKIAEAQGQKDLALENFKLYNVYKDSIQNHSELAKIASLQLEYETYRKQTEINSLTKESLLKNKLLLLATVGILVVLIFFLNAIRNYYRIKHRNNEILQLNEEIRTQRDSLIEKTIRIESLHRELSEINKSLEQTVKQKTEALNDQTKHLEDYAFIVAHKLRGPLARVLGVVNLLEKDIPMTEQKLLLMHLKNASGELDSVIRTLSHAIEQGLDAFDSPQSPKASA